MLHCSTCGRQYADDFKVCPQDGTLLQADATVAVGPNGSTDGASSVDASTSVELPPVALPNDPLIGRTFDDKYRLDARLGIGGMGTVYRATHLLIDRPVAIKVLNPRFVEDEAAQTRFRREARAAGRLQHANAVAVTDFGRTEDGYVYIVMELLEGRTLREVLVREAPLDTARAVSISLQTAAAVAAAHEAGIIHRDLKPANIFIMQRAHAPAVVKVLDFGIAKLAAEALDDDDHQTLTQVGVMIGTPRYMSPEQCDGAKLTPASDVYSLGIILYEMLTGTTPFTGSSPLAVALKHSTEPPRPPHEYISTVPPELEQVVMHALEKNPLERPPDAGAFRRELYATAERLGLEHAARTSGPTIETLRNAGTETPSGRLVIDIERLRESRAAAYTPRETTLISSSHKTDNRPPSDNAASSPAVSTNAASTNAASSTEPATNDASNNAASTSPSSTSAASIDAVATNAASVDAPSTNVASINALSTDAASTNASSTEAATASPASALTDDGASPKFATALASSAAQVEPSAVSRFSVPLDQAAAHGWRYWVRQPPVMLVIGLTTLTLIVALVAAISTNSPAADANNQAASLASPSPGSSPAPSASPSPEATAEEREASRRKAQREAEQGSRPARRPEPQRQKGGSKIGKVFGKVKKIFKNPF